VHIGRATILVDDREIAVDHFDSDMPADAEPLWIDAADLPRINGFEVHERGACRGDICVPLTAGLRRGALIDVAAFARMMGQPVVADAASSVWSLGEMPAHAGGLASRVAPDVAVPDRAGRPVHFAALRGKKLLVVTWASW